MLVQCYQAYKGTLHDDYCYNLVIGLGGWASLRVDSILFFVPENRASLLILAHPLLVRRPDQDYVV